MGVPGADEPAASVGVSPRRPDGGRDSGRDDVGSWGVACSWRHVSPARFWSCRAERCDRRERVLLGCAAESRHLHGCARSGRTRCFPGGLSAPPRSGSRLWSRRRVGLWGVLCSVGACQSRSPHSSRTTCAGLPATVARGAASCVTTLPPPTTAPSPNRHTLPHEPVHPHKHVVPDHDGRGGLGVEGLDAASGRWGQNCVLLPEPRSPTRGTRRNATCTHRISPGRRPPWAPRTS